MKRTYLILAIICTVISVIGFAVLVQGCTCAKVAELEKRIKNLEQVSWGMRYEEPKILDYSDCYEFNGSWLCINNQAF